MPILRPTLVLLAVLVATTGVVYPLALTGVAGVLFPEEARGSLVRQDGIVVGSRWIGQPFDDPAWFWGRPSATLPLPYDATASGGSNLGPTNPVLADAVRARIARLRAVDPDVASPVPVDLVTTSASGLDPDISPAAALVQVRRVARQRGLDAEAVQTLVRCAIRAPVLGFLGAPRVNVLELNLALDRMAAP